MENKPGIMQRWNTLQPNKTVLFWACVTTAVLTVVIGFNWAGWSTATAAQRVADASARDAVVQRLVPICLAQYDQDPNRAFKFEEMTGQASSQRVRYVQDQGWATITGEAQPDRNVANACARLIFEMSP